MDTQAIINALLGVAAFFGIWTLRGITKTIERLDDDVRKMPVNYVSKDDYRRDIDELKNICKQIFDKLDSKADK